MDRAMRKEIHDLIEAVRRLDIRISDGSLPGCVKLGGPAMDFPARLMEVQRALEAVDKAGGADAALGDSSVSADAAAAQAAQLRTAIDGVFRWMRVQGLDVSEPMEIVGDALEVPQGKRKKSYQTLPVFAPNGCKRRKGYRPKLNLLPAYEDRDSLKDVRKHAYAIEQTEQIMGHAVAKPSGQSKRPRTPFGPVPMGRKPTP